MRCASAAWFNAAVQAQHLGQTPSFWIQIPSYQSSRLSVHFELHRDVLSCVEKNGLARLGIHGICFARKTSLKSSTRLACLGSVGCWSCWRIELESVLGLSET